MTRKIERNLLRKGLVSIDADVGLSPAEAEADADGFLAIVGERSEAVEKFLSAAEMGN